MKCIVIPCRHEAANIELHARQSTTFPQSEKAQAWLIGEHGILTHAKDGGSWQTSNQKVSVMMLITRVVMTIRTGRCTPHSAARFTRVAATRLAQSHPSPQVARELPHFLWKWHRLIKIGQELTKDISSCHLLCTPRHFFSIVSLSHVLAIAPAKTLS